MRAMTQRALLGLGVVALAVLLVEIGLSVAATTHGSRPVQVEHVDAGPYPLRVSLYTDPARAGFALPFAIASSGTPALTYQVTSTPEQGPPATPVRATLTPDPAMPGGVQGLAEITVRGVWSLDITVQGPRGIGHAQVPVTATAPPAIPAWLGWVVGFAPLYGLFGFLLLRPGRGSTLTPT
jgi:hypothetical protein